MFYSKARPHCVGAQVQLSVTSSGCVSRHGTVAFQWRVAHKYPLFPVIGEYYAEIEEEKIGILSRK